MTGKIFHIITVSALFFAAALFFASCENDRALTVANQEEQIGKYINNKYSGCEVVRNGGSSRVIIVPSDTSAVVAAGDSVMMLVEGYTFESGPKTQFMEGTVVVRVGDGGLITGLDSGLIGARCNEESLILFSAKYGYYKKGAGIIGPMSALLYHVLIIDIKKNK